MRAVGAAAVMVGLLGLYTGLMSGLLTLSLGVIMLMMDKGLRDLSAIAGRMRADRLQIEHYSGEIRRNQLLIEQHLAAIIEAKKVPPAQ
jgi:hypothetical protein